MYVKYKVAEQSDDFKNFMRWKEDDPHESVNLSESFSVTEKDIENFSPKSKNKNNKKASKKTKGTLEDVLPEEEN